MPNAARVYNYLLGGKDNYEVDQMVAHRMLAVAPETKALAWFSRKFMLNSVKMAAEQGIRQFVDIGAGIPIAPNVHEIVHAVEPEARVVAADYDPVVIAHFNAALGSAPGVTTMLADVRAPDLLDRLQTEQHIDFTRPVAIVLVGVLHFIMDDEKPYEVVARLRDAMAPGSYLIFTQGGDTTTEEFKQRTGMDTAKSSAQPAYRTHEETLRFLDGFEIVEPGLVPVQQWLGDDLPDTQLVLFGGIGRKG
ncbi:SAM-dependent methyltransferase [Nocardia huaxiensis]|uniref:SAM-dependent methyltransferase n=2 Tax=Nocardia huaxiensis TaxID=2755382 RepID=A0A7D6VFN3_9NOCA|nr:SAM-dependent methyltransferase [Nocardia huaxiensis]